MCGVSGVSLQQYVEGDRSLRATHLCLCVSLQAKSVHAGHFSPAYSWMPLKAQRCYYKNVSKLFVLILLTIMFLWNYLILQQLRRCWKGSIIVPWSERNGISLNNYANKICVALKHDQSEYYLGFNYLELRIL